MELSENTDFYDIEDLSDIDFEGALSTDDVIESSAVEENIDPFSGKFDLSFYGISPNVILKENPEIIKLIISLTVNSAATRKKILSLISDMEIFKQHMEYKYADAVNHPDIPFDTASQILTDFTRNLNAIRDHVEKYNYNVSDVDSKELGSSLDVSSAISYLTAMANIQESIRMTIGVDSADTNPKLCAAINIAKKYKAFLFSLDQLQGIRDRYLSIKEYEKSASNQDRESVIIADALAYSNRNYSYTNDELTVMEYYDFPYLYCGMEKYFKSSPKDALEVLIKDPNASRSKAQQNFQEVEARKVELVHKCYIRFTRKKIMCEDNAASSVNTNCIYF